MRFAWGNLNPLAPMCALYSLFQLARRHSNSSAFSQATQSKSKFKFKSKPSHAKCQSAHLVEISIRFAGRRAAFDCMSDRWVGGRNMVDRYGIYAICYTVWYGIGGAFCLLDLLTFCATLHFSTHKWWGIAFRMDRWIDGWMVGWMGSFFSHSSARRWVPLAFDCENLNESGRDKCQWQTLAKACRNFHHQI